MSGTGTLTKYIYHTKIPYQVLFYEDTSTIREFQEKFKTYEDKFPACTFLGPPGLYLY